MGTRLRDWTEANVHAILLIRHGQLAYEEYFAGEDERYGHPLGTVDFDGSKMHDLRSVTKSVVSLLVGIALDRRWLQSIDLPVLSFFPEHRELHSTLLGTVTWRHLLTMTAGFAWDETRPYSDPANSERRLAEVSDRCRYVLQQPLVTTPGATFLYNGGLTILLAEMLSRATGRSIEKLAEEELFRPLGIAAVEWNRFGDATANATSGLRMRPTDAAKIGQLVLNRGVYNGKLLVPESWILESTSTQVVGSGMVSYGLHWWSGNGVVHGRDYSWTAAVGFGGQRLFVVPSENLVVVILAGLYMRADLASSVGEAILLEHVLKAIVS
jgi:CubicO group peptidase (beta-lactamase class C family)